MGALVLSGMLPIPRRPPFVRSLVPLVTLATSCLLACTPAAHAPRRAHDPLLRSLPVFLYPTQGAARAVLVFFGNDVGFWQAHQRLAERLSGEGVAVAGFDVKAWMKGLPDDRWQARDSAFAAGIEPVMAHAVAELAPRGAPVLLGGHSIGAEIALWTAVHAPPARLVGVLAMSPGERGHLRVSLSDLTNAAEPTEPGSFDVPAQLAALPAAVRVAVVRGQHDQYRYADPDYARYGGARYRHDLVPFTGHSLKQLILAGPFVDRAVSWLLAGEDAATPPPVART